MNYRRWLIAAVILIELAVINIALGVIINLLK